MFLHLISDDKFVDNAITCFERNDPGEHVFVCLGSAKKLSSIKYLKQLHLIKFILIDSPEYNDLLKSLTKYTAVFVHSLIPASSVNVVNGANSEVVFVWLFWGAEFWSLKRFRPMAYLPLTKMLFYKHLIQKHFKKMPIIWTKYSKLMLDSGFKKTAKLSCRNLLGKNERSQRVTDENVIKAMHRVNYVIPVVDDDYLTLKKYINYQAKVLHWNYSPEVSFEQLEKLTISDKCMLIGNSGYYTNNHLDIFLKARRHRLNFNKIIAPLSYGDPIYINSVVRGGKLFLGRQFCPLLEFLPAQEYFDLISNCRVAVFNSRRQQALGNIVVCLYLGMKVFLRDENPISSFLTKHGIKCFSIQNDFADENLSTGMPYEQKLHNRETIYRLFRKESLDEMTFEMLQILKKNA